MTPAPMRPVHNALVILASFLVAGALLPWSSRFRLACAGAAVAVIVTLLVSRLRAHAGAAQTQAVSDTQARIDRIRAARARRMGPRR